MPEWATRSAPRKVTLAECCEEIAQRVDKPSESGRHRFVGLEHLESGVTSIRRWGSTEDVRSAMKLFNAGDIIVARRNVYLRRAAMADFDGVCSGDGIVLRPSGKVCVPGLLPFLLNTDAFWDYVSSQADGSMSKRITLKRLLEYEFALPSLEVQRRLAAILSAAGAISETLIRALECHSLLVRSMLERVFAWSARYAPLSDWCRDLITYGIVQAGPDTPGGVPYIRVSDMTSGPSLTIDGMLRTTHEIAARFKRSQVSTGDIVVALRGSVGLARVVPPELDGANLTQGTARVAVKDAHSRDYVFWALQTPDTHRQYRRYAKGSTFDEISLDALRHITIPVINKDAQLEIASQLNELESARDALAERLAASRKWGNTVLGALAERDA